MTLVEALKIAKRRRSRPEAYSMVPGTIIILLIIIMTLQCGANLYLADYMARFPREEAQRTLIAPFFARANMAWCALWLAVLSPISSYRGLADTAVNERLTLLPSSAFQRFMATLRVSIFRPWTLLPILLMAVAALLAMADGCSRAQAILPLGLDLLRSLLFGLAGFLVVLATAWRSKILSQDLEFLEVGAYAFMALANPTLTIIDGRPTLNIANRPILPPDSGGAISGAALLGAALLGAALLGAALMALVVVLTALGHRRFKGRRSRGEGSRGDPILRLYLTKFPQGTFALSYLVELTMIFTNPDLKTTVLLFVLAFAVLRMAWLLLFILHREEEFDRLLRAPSATAARLALYQRPLAIHALLCAAPLILYGIRLLAH